MRARRLRQKVVRTFTLRRLQVRQPLFDLACERLETSGSEAAAVGAVGELSDARDLVEASSRGVCNAREKF